MPSVVGLQVQSLIASSLDCLGSAVVVINHLVHRSCHSAVTAVPVDIRVTVRLGKHSSAVLRNAEVDNIGSVVNHGALPAQRAIRVGQSAVKSFALIRHTLVQEVLHRRDVASGSVAAVTSVIATVIAGIRRRCRRIRHSGAHRVSALVSDDGGNETCIIALKEIHRLALQNRVGGLELVGKLELVNRLGLHIIQVDGIRAGVTAELSTLAGAAQEHIVVALPHIADTAESRQETLTIVVRIIANPLGVFLVRIGLDISAVYDRRVIIALVVARESQVPKSPALPAGNCVHRHRLNVELDIIGGNVCNRVGLVSAVFHIAEFSVFRQEIQSAVVQAHRRLVVTVRRKVVGDQNAGHVVQVAALDGDAVINVHIGADHVVLVMLHMQQFAFIVLPDINVGRSVRREGGAGQAEHSQHCQKHRNHFFHSVEPSLG